MNPSEDTSGETTPIENEPATEPTVATGPTVAETPPVVVLVETQMGENIGAAARAMANFGLTELRLVKPRDGWPNDKARANASRADHIIDGAAVFDSFEAAIADLTVVLATTARGRDMLKPVHGPEAAVAEARQAIAGGGKAGIVFGRERWGLTNDEVARAHAIVTLPVEPTFASLNVAQAVLVLAYEWRRAALGGELPFQAPDNPPAPAADYDHLFAHLERTLDDASYFRPPEKRETMVRNLRNMLVRGGWSEQEVRTFRGVIAALERRHERKREDRMTERFDSGESEAE